jgi:hypothetical protein
VSVPQGNEESAPHKRQRVCCLVEIEFGL